MTGALRFAYCALRAESLMRRTGIAEISAPAANLELGSRARRALFRAFPAVHIGHAKKAQPYPRGIRSWGAGLSPATAAVCGESQAVAPFCLARVPVSCAAIESGWRARSW